MTTFLTYEQINPKVANRWRRQRAEALAKMTTNTADQSEDELLATNFSTNSRVANRQRNLRQSRRRTKR